MATEFQIGSIENSSYWSGLIDEIGIWSRVLTADEITALYNEGTGITYPFGTEEEETATTTTSTSTNAILNSILFNQAIQLTLFLLFYISWLFNSLFTHKKQWNN